jgi:propane monooxygenase small subunit
LTATRDWAEAFFATALVFEPLVGELFRSHFVMQVAAPQGDYVTPAIMGTGEADAVREQRGARQLFALLVGDQQHGVENRARLQRWVDAWAPLSVQAARGLQPVWSQVSEKVVRFEESFERSRTRFEGFLGELGLSIPKEL